MTLQRRLILAVLVCVPLTWVLAVALTYFGATEEINELYDTEMVRMAQQMYAVLPMMDRGAHLTPVAPPPLPESVGNVTLGDLAIGAWNAEGKPLHIDEDGDPLPRSPGVTGFADMKIAGTPWRLFYLEATGWRICVGQRMRERDELVLSYITAQALPLAAALPILIGLLVVAVRATLTPVRRLSAQIAARQPDDPRPLQPEHVPGELLPLVDAMNVLLARVTDSLEHERRLTADAAHEMRTPLAALKAQWEVARRSPDPTERNQAAAKVEAGLDRLTRLVSQMLTMSRLEGSSTLATLVPVDWTELAHRALSDCLWIAGRRNVEVELEWPPEGVAPLPLEGDPELLAMLLRNLLDNAIRYSPAGTVVTMAFGADDIVVTDQGPGMEAGDLARLGDRFFRASGSREIGSGLGISIALRIAQLHGVGIRWENRREGRGLMVTVSRAR